MVRAFLFVLLMSVISVLRAASVPLCSVTKYDEDSGLSQWHITQMLQDRHGMLWFATWNGLNRFDGYEFRCFKSQPGDGYGMTTNRVRNIRLDEKGNILCLIDEGEFLFDVATCTFRKPTAAEMKQLEEKGWQHTVNHSLLEQGEMHYTDRYGRLWRVTREGNLSYRDEETGSMVPYPLETPLDEIRFACPDRQGHLWLIAISGVYKLEFMESPIALFPQEHPTQVRSLFLDHKQRYWVTNHKDATVRLFTPDNKPAGYLGTDGKIHKQYTSFGSSVYCIMQGSSGSIWLGCKPDGLFRLREQEDGHFDLAHFSTKNRCGLNDDNVYNIKEDSLGRLWIATLGGGVNCMMEAESNRPRFVHKDNGLTGYPRKLCHKVRHIHITDDGVLLASTTEGLLVSPIPDDEGWEKMVFRHHFKEDGRSNSLSCSATMETMQDRRGRLFVCTESGGINLLESEDILSDTLSFIHFNNSNGMCADVTLSATEQGNDLWIVCSNRIVVLNVDASTSCHFDASFFHRQCRFSDARPLQLPDGRWMFGLHDGAFTLKADRMHKNDFIPPIALTGISIQNRTMNPAVNGLDTLVLQPDERNLTVRFAALDYSGSDRIDYAFRMDNGEEQDTLWNYIYKGQSATFLDMKPDTYTLMIRSTNADGVWVDNVRRLTVIVKPTFWETGWAIALWTVISLAVISLVLHTVLYIRRINRRQRETLEAYLSLLNRPEASPTYHSPVEEQSPVQPQLAEEDNLFMQRIMAFVEEHLSDADISIGDMALATATSRSGLNRKMRSILGITPLDFLREARIKRACQLLHDETLNISEVAFKCGFADPKYFSRCFKASTGLSPKEYRADKQNAT